MSSVYRHSSNDGPVCGIRAGLSEERLQRPAVRLDGVLLGFGQMAAADSEKPREVGERSGASGTAPVEQDRPAVRMR
jgi:hypothetical protein